jgi:hypothetical protein
MLITSPEAFVEWFTLEVSGAYRILTVQDAKDMTECGLIGRYGFYGRQDSETVRGILQYEQLRQKRIKEQSIEDKFEPLKCKSCGQPLAIPLQNKRGRHKEYCLICEPRRVRERYKKWRMKRQTAIQRIPSGAS